MLKRFLTALTVALGLASPALAAGTNFYQTPGTNGYIASPFTLLSTEINTLGSGACAVSSVGGTSGVFSRTQSGSSLWQSIYFTSGGSFTPAANQVLEGWFLRSPDGGTTFETVTATCSTTVPPLARQPDFIIPLSAAAYASGNDAWANGGDFVPSAFGSYKIELWNTGTTALPSSGNTITSGPTTVESGGP